VLVIDDEYGARLQVELALLTSGVLEIGGMATDGARGAELAEQLQPDVIVLDLAMPVMDGLEALPLLRSVAPRATILIRSSSGDADAIDTAMKLGAAAYVPKFMHPDDLCDILECAARGVASPTLVHAVVAARAGVTLPERGEPERSVRS
jgi:DNA-binding NarL/FixJ family response regulator